jgi:hypothetical protein
MPLAAISTPCAHVGLLDRSSVALAHLLEAQ